MSSPVFTENSPFARGDFQRPLNTELMTMKNVTDKSLITFGLTVAAIAVGWFLLPPVLVLPAVLAALVLSIVAAVRKTPSAPLYLTTTGVYGLGVGAISGWLETLYPGIVSQAVIATLCVIGVTFGLYKFAGFRTSPRLNKIFFVALIAYVAFSLVNVGMMVFGATDSAWGLRTDIELFGIPLGIILGLLAVVMGAYSLIMDFEFIENGVARGLPAAYGWTAAYGLVMTVVWIYVEILRIAAIIRGN